MDIIAWVEETKNHFLNGKLKWLVLAPFGAYIVYKVIRKSYREYHLPPGPVGWPWLGYTPCLRQGAFKRVQSLCEKYGPITSFRVCGKLVVILSDEKSIKEVALRNRALIGRYSMLSNHSLARGYGLFNYDGEHAVALRRILVRGIHQLLQVNTCQKENAAGVPQNSVLDEILSAECDNFIKHLQDIKGESFKVTRMMWYVIWKASFAIDCPLDEDTITEFVQHIGYINANTGPFQYKQMLPHILTGLVRRCETLRQILGAGELWDRYQQVITAIRLTVAKLWSSPDRSKDCLLSYFRNDGEYKMSEADAVQLLLEVMAAGVDTTALTLVWFCYALANGILELSPGEAFTESKLEEVHRLASVVPMAIPHCARFDSYVGRYIIPKGSIVIFNLYSVHQAQLREIARGNSTGGCPFAHEQTSKQKLYFCESALPFSVGSRACPGFMLATHILTRVASRLTAAYKVVNGEYDRNAPELQLNGITRPQRDDSYRFIALN